MFMSMRPIRSLRSPVEFALHMETPGAAPESRAIFPAKGRTIPARPGSSSLRFSIEIPPAILLPRGNSAKMTRVNIGGANAFFAGLRRRRPAGRCLAAPVFFSTLKAYPIVTNASGCSP
jgi:hypothetical protein